MSYDPAYRKPPRQDRWPHASPQEAWPAYSGGDGQRDADQAWGAAGAFADAGSGHAAANGCGYGGYPGTSSGYADAGEAYTQASDSFDGGYGGPADQYAGAGTSHGWDGYGYGGAWDDLQGEAVYSDHDGYAEPGPATRSGPALIAPDIIGEQGWLADPYRRPARDRDHSGLVIGAVTGFLAAAVAIGVATLAAAFVRPQASPIIAVGGAFIDRTPPALKNFAVQHFGENDKTILLFGMYVTIGFIAMGIGCLARRNVSIGVAGLAAFGLFGAFVAITRPESRAIDVLPSVIGGIAGGAALLWLARAAAPVVAVRPSAPAPGIRHARGGRRRGAR